MDEQREQNAGAGTRRIHTFREWNGWNRLISLVRDDVTEDTGDLTHDGEQQMDWTYDEHWCLPVPSHFPLHANAEWRERARAEARPLGVRNRVTVEVENGAETTSSSRETQTLTSGQTRGSTGSWEGSPRQLCRQGSAGSLWSGVCKKDWPTWTHSLPVDEEGRGITATWASGSTLGGGGRRWRKMCPDTFAGADHTG